MTFSNNALTGIAHLIGSNKALKHLTLSLIHNKIADEGAQALVDGFTTLKDQLETLNLILISNAFSEKTGKIFEQFLPTLSKATSLYLSFYGNSLGTIPFSSSHNNPTHSLSLSQVLKALRV